MPDGLHGSWTRVAALAELQAEGRMVLRLAGKQVALFRTDSGVFACNNRCPHEGYPLREGSLSAGADSCILTCNWHNWKFDLRDGANLYGGDRLRVYPVRIAEGAVWLDLSDPPAESRRAEILTNLRNAFGDEDYDRMARELARFRRAGGDLADALAAAICWSHDRFEFGWTHAYAGAADWLALYDERSDDPEAQLICILEPIAHLAHDVLREPRYPHPEGLSSWDENGFVAAVEREDETAAVAMVRGALSAGLGFTELERAFTRAALLHYADFGHSLIYVSKAERLIDRLGETVAEPLLLTLVRSLVKASREDLIPEFRGYAAALANWHAAAAQPRPAPLDGGRYRGLNVDRALALTVEHAAADPMALYDASLGANADNMLRFDSDHQLRVDVAVQDNVGWLDYTHGLTFANAVRRQCTRFPELWPHGLLQLACFAGRNARHARIDDDGRWRVADPGAFLAGTIDRLLDHGQPEPIVSVHLLKTAFAVREEIAAEPSARTATTMLAALSRFLSSPLRRKHVRRTARQAAAFVALDG